MPDNLITDDSNDKAYFTILPNIIWEKDLSVHDLWLYATIKRVAGENGECYMSSRKLAELAGMSVGIVSGSKGNLAQAGLIEISLEKRSEKGWAVHHIKVVDLWGQNMAHFQNCSPHEQIDDECSAGDQYCSLDDRNCSPGDTEEDPLKKIPKEDKSDDGLLTFLQMNMGPHKHLLHRATVFVKAETGILTIYTSSASKRGHLAREGVQQMMKDAMEGYLGYSGKIEIW